MEAMSLASALMPQLEKAAEIRMLSSVTRVQVVVGTSYGVSAEGLCASFGQAYRGTRFQDATTDVVLVGAGESFTPPGADETVTATGYEVFIATIEGC